MVITRRENKRDVIWFVLLKVFWREVGFKQRMG
jgi:hypothetical protein